jgi:hypothetical protein
MTLPASSVGMGREYCVRGHCVPAGAEGKKMMSWQIAIFALIGALIAAAGSGIVVRGLLEWIRPFKLQTPPKGVKQKTWMSTFPRGSGAKWLGPLEAVLAFLSLWFNLPAVLAAWFAFKIAAKWEAWRNVIQLPDQLPALGEPAITTRQDAIDYLRARNELGSLLFDRFLLGTLLNVFAGAIAWVLVSLRWKDLVQLFCD